MRKRKLIYRCMVWHCNGASNEGLSSVHIAVPSAAYGMMPERDTLTEAMNDKVAIYAVSMKGSKPGGAFFASVVHYPRGFPPKQIRRTMYLEMGGDE